MPVTQYFYINAEKSHILSKKELPAAVISSKLSRNKRKRVMRKLLKAWRFYFHPRVYLWFPPQYDRTSLIAQFRHIERLHRLGYQVQVMSGIV